MQNKRGIRIKTKETSLVDNIMSFFKKENADQLIEPQLDNKEPKSDVSPRSTTPRKRIFEKTPEKAGTINFLNANNKSMDAAYQITFNHLEENRNIPHLSSKNVSYSSNIMGDTQFNRLILDIPQNNVHHSKQFQTSNLNRPFISPRTPPKTFLSDNPQRSINIAKPSNDNQSFKKNSTVSVSASEYQRVKNLQKQIKCQNKLIEDLKKENQKLKRQNQDVLKQNEMLKKQLKSYQLSAKNMPSIQVIHLQAPKSPFQKIAGSKLNENKQIKQNCLAQNRQKMKQSIPIMPQISHQYGQKRQLPKLEQVSLMSINLKSISQQNSFISDDQSFQDYSNKLLNGKNNSDIMFIKKNIGDRKNNNEILSPLMQRTVYEKTMKPQKMRNRQKERFETKNEQEQITFSKTVGYLKGDQPIVEVKPCLQIQQIRPSLQVRQKHNLQNQKLRSQFQNRNKNPFQQIATDSNKFYFKEEKIMSPSNNSFKVVENKNNHQTRQWLTFSQNQSSLQYSNNTGSRGNTIASQNGNTKNNNLIQNQTYSTVNTYVPSNNKSKSPMKGTNQYNNNINKQSDKRRISMIEQQQDNGMGDNKSLSNKSKSKVSSKMKIEESKTYKFEDFDMGQDQSAVDYF